MFTKYSFHSNYSFSFLMAAISGFSDMFSFIALNKLFSAHITGNLIVFVSLIINNRLIMLPQLFAIPVFIVVAFLISILIESIGINRKVFSIYLMIESLLFLALWVLGITILPQLQINEVGYILISMMPVIAMSIHNTILKIYTPRIPPCTVMTGNLAVIITNATEMILHRNRKNPPSFKKIHFSVFVGFSIGCLVGALGYIYMKFNSIIFMLILICLAIYLIIFHTE